MPSNFLWFGGASNSGLLATPLTLMTTELNALTNASVAVSSVGGAAGKFTNADTAQAMFAHIHFTLGSVTTMIAGANLSGWFLESPDSGTTFEPTGAAPARAPDFIIPLPLTTGGGTYKSQGLVRVPALQFKVLVQNNSGQTFTATGNTLKLAPVAVQY